jgi:hypothetical protein
MADDKVLDFNKKREDNIEHKRRAVERIMFDNFLGTYSVIDGAGGIYPIDIIDISRSGCMIQVPYDKGTDKTFKEGEEFTLRLYFTKASYIPAHVTIKYGKEFTDKNDKKYMQFGCEFDTEVASFEALESFINFLYKFAEHSAVDRGDSKIYFL